MTSLYRLPGPPGASCVRLVTFADALRYRIGVLANLTGGQLVDRGYWRRHAVPAGEG